MLAIGVWFAHTPGMQGKSDPNRELLDAAALCRQLVPAASVEAFLADHRRELFPDGMFGDLFASRRGRPSVPADVVATVMVLQALEGLSDRDAAKALRDRISWKVAAGLALDDTGVNALGHHAVRLVDAAACTSCVLCARVCPDAVLTIYARSRRA